MTQYTLYTVSPPDYIHSRCFEELSLSLCAGLQELGYSAKETTSADDMQGRVIVLGAHLLTIYPSMRIPANAIIFNTEQIRPDALWMSNAYMDLLRKHTVWDYSHENLHALAKRGVEGIDCGVQGIYCGIGYHEVLTRIQPAEYQDIDVLFYGSTNVRRMKIINEIRAAGINIFVAPLGTYGAERDALIARSKIVLNLHFYEDAPFEIVRCSYLWANEKCVVSEHYQYSPIIRQILFLLDRDKYQGIANYDCRKFMQVRQADYLRSALEATALLELLSSHQQPLECVE